MNELTVLPSTSEHFDYIRDNLTSVCRSISLSCDDLGYFYEDTDQESLDNNRAFTYLIEDEPVAIVSLPDNSDTDVYIWAIFTDRASKNKYRMIRNCRQILERLKSQFNFIRTSCMSGDDKLYKWHLALGFRDIDTDINGNHIMELV
ncbi:hypothetical protein BJAS_P3452 [Bathymodiolus japonicus methanotrophic gill symbiont]|uniref:hypothetical protein n=1 Tax=Bathymodiolus japonicus methanotrophic gill symbiont TaxID=113269 RepID=UPI001B70EF50|nr:hypothetical protein [Bathymodiolus japonicus methanotrophic gill symbiont]GFO72915.1 hypothetical protein BJAS_P3452 [Bathymodiolus japonicus methanotrophic gill symbiont]